MRPHFGRNVDLTVIDSAIRQANRGLMRRLTDLSLETLRLDGHASALWQKRLNRLAVLPWVVEPASGTGVDKGRAEDYAGFVREMLEQLPNFRQCLMDLNQGAYHGRAASEVQWDLHRGTWRVRDLHWIHARRLSFGPNRDVRVIDLRHEVGNFEDVGYPLGADPYKFITYTPRMFGDYPEREGLAPRTVFWSYFARFGVRERMHLLEIFGKPWRIAIPKRDQNNPTAINQEQIEDAFEILNSLGGESTAVLPVEMDVQIPQPSKGAGDVHDMAIEHAQLTMSKLYLGATGTTDAVSTGLGSSIGNAHVSEEDLLIASDAWRLSETVEDQLTDAIIVCNFGVEAVRHAPRFRITTDPPSDRKSEAELLKAILDVGVDVSLAEARERLGVREIEAGEAFLRRIPRNINGSVPFYSPLPEIIHPTGSNPDPGEIADIPHVEGAPPPNVGGPPPTAKAEQGGTAKPIGPGAPPPPQLPAGNSATMSEDDDTPTDAALACERLAAKMTEHGVERCAHAKVNRCRLCGIERERDFTFDDSGEVTWHVIWKPIGAKSTAVDPALLPEEPDDLDGEIPDPMDMESRKTTPPGPPIPIGS